MCVGYIFREHQPLINYLSFLCNVQPFGSLRARQGGSCQGLVISIAGWLFFELSFWTQEPVDVEVFLTWALLVADIYLFSASLQYRQWLQYNCLSLG